MKVKYKCDNQLVMETWIDANKKGKDVILNKGDIFKTQQWGNRIIGISESVVTDKNEWICDVDCKEFNKLFDIVENS